MRRSVNASVLGLLVILGATPWSEASEEPTTCALVEVDRGGDIWINGEAHLLADVRRDNYRAESGESLAILMPDYEAAMSDAVELIRSARQLQQEDSTIAIQFQFPTDRSAYIELFSMDPLAVRQDFDPPPLRFTTESSAECRDLRFQWIISVLGGPAATGQPVASRPLVSLCQTHDGLLHALLTEKDTATQLQELSDLRDRVAVGEVASWVVRTSGDVDFGAAEQVAHEIASELGPHYVVTIEDSHTSFSIQIDEEDHYIPPPPHVQRRVVRKVGAVSTESPIQEPRIAFGDMEYRACYMPKGRRQAEMQPN